MKLYRAISQNEKDDYDTDQQFRTGVNTLEAKQFFRSPTAVKQFIESSVLQDYDPPYAYLLTITADDNLLEAANPEYGKLDGYEAITIAEDNLLSFNQSVIFVEEEEL